MKLVSTYIQEDDLLEPEAKSSLIQGLYKYRLLVYVSSKMCAKDNRTIRIINYQRKKYRLKKFFFAIISLSQTAGYNFK